MKTLVELLRDECLATFIPELSKTLTDFSIENKVFRDHSRGVSISATHIRSGVRFSTTYTYPIVVDLDAWVKDFARDVGNRFKIAMGYILVEGSSIAIPPEEFFVEKR